MHLTASVLASARRVDPPARIFGASYLSYIERVINLLPGST